MAARSADSIDLGSGCRGRVESVVQPFGSEAAGEFEAHDALTEAEHLSVVTEHGPLDGVAVVRGHGTDAGDLVSADSHAEAGAAHQQRPVRAAISDQPGRRHGDVRVSRFIVGGDTDVDNLRDPVVGREVLAQGFLVSDAGGVTADDDPQLALGHCWFPSSTVPTARRQTAMETAPASGVPMLFSARGRARPTCGRSWAVSAAAPRRGVGRRDPGG
jgi:hypothetical protein